MLLNITNSYPVLIVFCIGLGLADGCFWCVEGPIAYDICGPSGAAQAIGFLKGLMGISFAAGPPIAGKFQSITHKALYSGLIFIISTCVLSKQITKKYFLPFLLQAQYMIIPETI